MRPVSPYHGTPIIALAGFLIGALALFTLPDQAHAQDGSQAKIQSAESAAIPAITDQATIMDWDQTVLREGTSGWTCFPDFPDTSGNDPMCLDGPWLKWAHAWMNQEDFEIDRVGFGYMLQGGSPESNVDPYAEGPTDDNEWLAESVPHVMMIVPDPSTLEGMPTHPDEAGGGPWVMWRGTPYVHVMIPTHPK